MDKKQKILWKLIPILIGVMILGIALFIKIGDLLNDGQRKVITSSTLMDTIDIEELSTAEFTYNGIANIYKDKDKKNVKCYIRYFANVKAYISVQDIEYEIDDEKHTVKPVLPKLQYKIMIVDDLYKKAY